MSKLLTALVASAFALVPTWGPLGAALSGVDALFYVDGVHLTAHAPIDVQAMGAEFYVCSPYKFLGPHLGMLAASPALLETMHPDKLRPSTEQVPERFELGTLPYELLAVDDASTDATLEVFRNLYAATQNTWLRNAMALAILTAQRREDIALAQFKDFGAEGWRCIQAKTGHKLILPLDLRLDVIGLSLADVLRQCRTTGIVSRHLVHQVRPYGNSPIGAPIWKDTLSKAFHAEVLALGMDWEGRQPPTFHELRSLSERLYAAQGNVNTQSLLGHRDPRTTAIYKDTRGAEWNLVKIG